MEFSVFFFFNQKTSYEMRISDWSSDVCSSDLMGVRLALDDFGTGYSSLGYLRKASFSKIKIDRSFIRGIDNRDGENVAIVRAIVALANSLGMITTAEGAETQEEVEALRELGCEQNQGLAYGKPMNFEAANALVSAQIGRGAGRENEWQ